MTSDWWDVEDEEIEMPPSFPLKVAPSDYVVALERCWLATGFPDRKRCLIGIDGLDGAGKSSLGAWLAWQLGTPCIFLDDYRVRRKPPRSWRVEAINRLLNARFELNRPVVIESVFLLEALRQLGREPDLLIYVESQKREPADAMEGLVDYVAREGLPERADVVVRWSGDGPRADRPWTAAKT
ncbi:hypothetical protein [Methylobacterium sp. A52T]